MGCCESVAVCWLVVIGRLVAVSWPLWVGCCGLVATLWVSCYRSLVVSWSLVVGWSLWVGGYAIGRSLKLGRFGSVGYCGLVAALWVNSYKLAAMGW